MADKGILVTETPSNETDPIEIQKQAISDSIAHSAGRSYVFCNMITMDGQSIVPDGAEVAVRWLAQNRYLYCDNTDEAIAEFKAAHREAVSAGYIVYEGKKPEFIEDADKYVDNNIDVFMRKGHYEGADFYQTPVPSYIDSEPYDGKTYDTNGNETTPLYQVSDEIIKEDE